MVSMLVSVAQIKAKFTAIARQAQLGEEVIITTRGKPAYRLLAIVETPERQPFPDITALAMKSRPYSSPNSSDPNHPGPNNFVADWRAQNERF
jgi:prevent-host-death family protein